MSDNLISVSEIKEDFSNIKVKTYLPFTVKKIMVDNIFDSIVAENENGLKIIDYSLLQFVKDFTLINNYSNLDFTELDTIEIYDLLKENGTLKYIIEKIPQEELSFFSEVISNEIQQIKEIDNSIQSILSKVLNKLIDKIPSDKALAKIIKDIPKQIEKIDPSKLKFIKDAIDFNNGVERVD
jgi:hypothetical protein